jgi:hypothetical protein
MAKNSGDSKDSPDLRDADNVRALDALTKRTRAKNLQILDAREVTLPGSGERVRLFRASSKDEPNGPQVMVGFDAAGAEIDDSRLAAAGEASFPVGSSAPAGDVSSAPITINPKQNVFTLSEGETISESIIVTVPPSAGVKKADVYFLADNTGSMNSFINAVKTGASTILSSLPSGIDFAVGVGNYQDFPIPLNPYAFQNQLSPAAVPANNAGVIAAINGWTAGFGNDTPEGAFYALDRLAVPAGTAPINWIAGSKRIIVQFGDAPSHDPICTIFTGDVANITEASVTAKLVAEQISLLAISTATPGLDDNPNSSSTNYGACTPAGAAGQASRITAATNGAFTTSLNPSTIVATIINLITAAVSQINNVSVVATGATAPLVVSITPAGGYGPLSGDKEHNLQFDIIFKAPPCKDSVTQILNGALDVVADGSVVATKPVSITVPPCKPKELFTYSVKFVCGTAAACDCECGPVRPGIYATEINIHNFQDVEASLQKFVIPVVLAGAAAGREPKFAGRKATDRILLPPHTATMDDCCRLAELLFGAEPSGALPLTIGFLEVVSPVELSITAVYTATDANSHAISIDVEQIDAHKVPVRRT